MSNSDSCVGVVASIKILVVPLRKRERYHNVVMHNGDGFFFVEWIIRHCDARILQLVRVEQGILEFLAEP